MRFLTILGLLSLAACSASSDPAGPPQSEEASTPEDKLPAAVPQANRCAAVRAAIEPAVNAALSKAKARDVGIGVTTNECGFVGYTAGRETISVDALWRIGSITKTYVAALVLDFVREGKVDLDDTIARFDLGLPNEQEITVRQLLNHSSGLFNYNEDAEFPQHTGWTPKERLAVAASHPVYFEPGAGWHYSNTNYLALGMISEQLGGAHVGELIRTRILAPQGLDHTFFSAEEKLGGTLAPSYSQSGARLSGAPKDSFGAWADGAMAATLEDTTHWMRAYASGSVTPTLTKDLFAGVPIPDQPLSYSLALFDLSPEVTGDVAAYGHGGDIPGFHSWSVHLPDRGWTITAIVNQDGGDANPLLEAMTEALKACTDDGEC